jgi:hypothetical protein
MNQYNIHGFDEEELDQAEQHEEDEEIYMPTEEEWEQMEQDRADRLISQRGKLTELTIHNGLCICNCPGQLKSYSDSCDIKTSSVKGYTKVTYTCKTCGLKHEVNH